MTSPSPPADDFLAGLVNQDLVDLPEYKSAGVSSVDFGGLLGSPLRLHEDLKEGCGGQLWPAGMVLAKHLLRQKEITGSILELGAGGGLVGLAVALHHRVSVHITDQQPMLHLMRKNIELNHLDDQVTASVYDWGSPRPDAISPPDVLLAADCVYFEPAFPLLQQTMLDLIGENTICYFCFKKRRRADLNFVKACKKLFRVEELEDPDRPTFSRENLYFTKKPLIYDEKRPALQTRTLSAPRMPFSRASSAKNGEMKPPRSSTSRGDLRSPWSKSPKDGDVKAPSRTNSSKDGEMKPPRSNSAKSGEWKPPRTSSSKSGEMRPPRTDSAKSGEMEGPRPHLLKRNTFKSAFGKLTTTISRIKPSSSGRSSDEGHRSPPPRSAPCLDPRRRTQVSVSKPCTRASMQITLGGGDGTCETTYESKRPNNWYNLQRKLQGECNYRYGTCDYKSIPVFQDGDSVDESKQALDVEEYWRSNPLRKRSGTFPELVVSRATGRDFLRKVQSQSLIEGRRGRADYGAR
ncbi:Protein-lysine N-methyltransferase rrg1 [Sphaceloma murrayae]|uniref:Protein-lysine N-methyltransferase EFM6 n=1 Tax=Sphaceloma murrayae TaxID=2082308 RepID=A0A2K1QXD2_9PEZI|nr:Protein-lysine N-methyltransferase rrg1 [Sphaceloma murrayae]